MPKYNVQIEITYKSFHEDEIEAESEEHAEDIFWDDYSGNDYDSFKSMKETSTYDDEHVTHIEELREFDDAKD